MAGPQQRAAPALVFELSAVEASASTLLVRGLHHGQAPHAEARHHAAPQVAAARWLNFPPPSHKAQPHAAADRLNTQLQSLEAPGSLHVLELDAGKQQQQLEQQQGAAAATASSSSRSSATTAATSTTPESSWGRRLCGLALRVGDMTQPQGEAPGDASWGERTFNVLTSLPFVAVGWHMHRQRLTPEGRAHARTLMAVGAAATLYHATSGSARRLARKIDYWTIAYSSSALVKSVYADSPGMRRAASLSLLAVPFRPFAVSCANALLMQAEFVRQAVKHKAVRVDLKRHYAAAALGVGAFFAEDLVMYSGWGGYVHSAWHCLACYGVATLDGLLAHKERQQLQAQLERGGDPATPGLGGAKPLRRPVHSSASSLPSYGQHSYGYRGSKLAGSSPAGSSPAGSSPALLSPPPGWA